MFDKAYNMNDDAIRADDFFMEEDDVALGGVPQLLDGFDIVPGVYDLYISSVVCNTDTDDTGRPIFRSVGVMLGIDRVVEVMVGDEARAPHEGLLFYGFNIYKGPEQFKREVNQFCFTTLASENDPSGRKNTAEVYAREQRDLKNVLQFIAHNYDRGSSLRLRSRLTTALSKDKQKMYVNFGTLSQIDKDAPEETVDNADAAPF